MKFDGGKAVVQRILQAYGFTMQKQLHDHLGVGNGTVSTWIKRNYFPGEVVIRCALETGADLEWLATGYRSLNNLTSDNNDAVCGVEINSFSISDGLLKSNGCWVISRDLICNDQMALLHIVDRGSHYLATNDYSVIKDGVWVLDKGGVVSIDEIKIMPDKKFLVNNVLWPKSEVSFIYKIIYEIKSYL